MFHKTFDTASDQDERAVPPGLQLALSSETQDCSSSMLASPDSNSSISIMSDAEASSSPDVLDSCILDCSQVNNLHNTKTRHDGLCNATMNVNETFTATAVNDTINFWNETFILMSQDDVGSQEYITFSQCPKGETFHAGAPPCSATKDCLISTCETPCRGSTENDCLSVSSGEMIVRSNSFGLDDQAQVLVSSLDESICAAGDVGTLPADSNLLSVTLPDIWENPPKGNVESKGNPCLDLTFTQEVNCDCPTEDNDVALSDSMVALPAENEGLLTTFVCETTASCQKEETRAEAEPLPSTLGAVARDPQPAVQEREESICTSTPIQPAVNRRPNLPLFSASPFCDGAGSAGVPVKRNASKRSAAAGQSPLANKKTMEIKKFPKSDFSHVKPKIVTRVPVAATGPTSQRKAPQAEVSKMKKFAIALSTKPKAFDFAQRRRNASASNLGTPLKESSAPNKQGERTGPQSDNQPVANDLASAGQSSNAASEGEPTESQQAGSDTACLAALEQSPDRCGQLDLQPAPKKVISSKNEVRSGSAFGQNKPAAIKTLLRRSSESSLGSQPPKEKRTLLKFSKSFTTPRARTHQDQTKAGNLKSFSQRELAAQASAASSPREDNTIPLVEGSDKSIPSGASGDDAKRGSRGKTPSRPARGTPLPKGPAPSPKPTTARLQLGTLGKIGCRIPKAGATLPLKPKIDAGSHKVPSSLGTHSAAGSRPQPNDSRPAQTPSRPPVKGPALTPSWRPPLRTPGSSHGPAKAKAQADGASTSQVSHGAGPKPTPLKSVFKAKLFSTPAKTLKPALATTCKAATPSLLTRSASARLVRPTFGGSVDKNKSRAGPRQQPPQPPATKPSQGSRPPDVDPPASVAEAERKGHIIQQLRGLLAASNCRFEAVAVVLQQSLAERDEATKQCRELSQELVSLQGELVCSVNSSERLEKEKEGLRVTLEETLHRVQEQHQKDLAELEQRLQAFYQAEWNKMHLAYQEEADKCNAALQQQMGELEAKHEAMKLDLENRHVEQLQSVKQQYENSLDELKQVHNEELQSLEKTLKDAEASLSGRIQELMEENGALMEKLTAEETRRKELAQKSQKDSHTLYLEQELESLKVVLDMKTTQLHQQEKKLMEVDKLTEKNMKLDEILKKVQQENEDLKARMERHAALSRQLSTEQAVLQESLQKESKVNKRLSMENEELLWKLNNNDLSSPRKVSPSSSSSSPSHAFSLQSPRSSGLLSSPPVSPR